MSTRTNLNNLRKLSSTIEAKSRYSTLQQPRLSQTVKLPALNAINKSVKYNDLSFATSRDLNKLRKEPEVTENYTEIAAHHILLGIRKKYDSINKVREGKERDIQDLQAEKHKYQIQKGKYVDEKSVAEKKVKNLQEELKKIKHLGEQSEMQKKVITNMVSRIKHDKIVYDQRKFDYEKQYNSITRTKHLIQKDNTNNHEQQNKTHKVYDKLVHHFDQQQRERNIHIASLQKMLEQKNNLLEYVTMRGSSMKEIAENTLQDKDREEKNWYKVYLCNRFVQKLLKDKMNRQMQKFSTVQGAYKTIKTQTGVSDIQTLISKFLNKQNIYGDLLGKIAQDEKQILELKTMNEDLVRQRTKLDAQNSVLYTNKKDKNDLTQQQKQLLNIGDKSTKCKLFYQRIRIWLQKNYKKFNKIEGKKQKNSQPNEIQIIYSFKKYIENLNKSLLEAKEAFYQQVNLNEAAVKNKSNLRVKLNDEKNQTGQNNQTKQTKQDDQDQFVNRQREDVHRDNQKFMRDLKKKVQEIRKNRPEGQAKRKQASPEKIKQGQTL